MNKTIGGDKCFNIINWFNKFDVYNVLNKSNLKGYLPHSYLFNEVNVSALLNKYKTVYIKPVYGNQGKNVHRLELRENGDIHISLNSFAPKLICRKNEDIQQKLDRLLGENDFIVQKGIQSSQIENRNYDVRVLVQKDIGGKWNVTAMVCRVADERYFNTGVYESIYDAREVFNKIYKSKKTKKNTIKLITKISIKAAQVLETHMGLLGELSVDFVLDKKMKLWIIELNGKPQKSIYKDIINFKYKQLIYGRPMEYAYYLSTK